MTKEQLKIGERVYSFKYGWGNIIQGNADPIAIKFEGGECVSYVFIEGKAIPDDIDEYCDTDDDYNQHKYGKNDLLTEEDKLKYDNETVTATQSDSFIL